ncbi:MAG: hypothetical protein ABW221_13710 [Vicinamibacteria bacterium]
MAFAVAALAGPSHAQTLGTGFTYQGRLQDGPAPAEGPHDLRCILFDAASGGAQVGGTLVLEDVPVSAGLFTAVLDFGAAPFAGDARWLEIAVRPGASTGAFTTLGARQQLRPSPNALFSTSAPWSGVSGKPAGFADGIDDDSGGTVTGIATGAGLTGGPITTTGTIAVAPGGIGLAQIDTSQVQARVIGTCPLGSYLRGINPDGSAVCTGLPNPHTVTVADDPADNVGTWSSIAIGTDGLPVISYQNSSAGDLKVLKCGNRACSAGNTISTPDASANSVGAFTSIAVPATGLPLVSYFDATAAALKLLRCANAACSSGVTGAVDDQPANSVGAHSSIAIPPDGRAVISYSDWTAGTLKVLKCGNAACNVGNVATTVDDPANAVGTYTSLALGSDGLPVISYTDTTAGALKVLKCGNAACNAGNVATTVDDPANSVGEYTSIAVGADGLPVVSYRDATAGRLKVAKCGNAACSAGNTITTLTGAPTGEYTSLAIGADGLPVISHRGTGGSLAVTRCGDDACSTGNLTSILDDPAGLSVGITTSIAIGADGLPIVSHGESTGGTLRIAKCGNAGCQQ